MAAPRDSDRAKVYYHGTSNEKAGEAILKSGIEPGDIVMPTKHKATKGANLVPMKGKVYITPDISYAQIYALGGDYAGHDLNKTGTGYLFVIDGADLQDIEPDEDSVGEMICYAARGKKYKDELRSLVYLAQDKLTDGQYKRLLNGEYVMWAHTGKKLMPLIPTEMKLKLIDLGAHVAHAGKLIPKHAYKLDLSHIKDLKKDGSNFIEFAEKVR